MAEPLTACPCGCGAQFTSMVGDREAGVRADAASGRRDHRLAGPDHHGGVYLVTGMPGAGKSTVGRQLAERFHRAAHIDIDMVFHHFTVAGRADPSHATAEAAAQSQLAVVNAAAMARNYVDAGFVCVIEGAVTRRTEVLLAARTVAPHPLSLIVLAPPLAVSESRDAARSGKTVAAHFRHLHTELHTELAGWGLWLDSTDHAPSDTVGAILRHGGTGRIAPA